MKADEHYSKYCLHIEVWLIFNDKFTKKGLEKQY